MDYIGFAKTLGFSLYAALMFHPSAAIGAGDVAEDVRGLGWSLTSAESALVAFLPRPPETAPAEQAKPCSATLVKFADAEAGAAWKRRRPARVLTIWGLAHDGGRVATLRDGRLCQDMTFLSSRWQQALGHPASGVLSADEVGILSQAITDVELGKQPTFGARPVGLDASRSPSLGRAGNTVRPPVVTSMAPEQPAPATATSADTPSPAVRRLMDEATASAKLGANISGVAANERVAYLDALQATSREDWLAMSTELRCGRMLTASLALVEWETDGALIKLQSAGAIRKDPRISEDEHLRVFRTSRDVKGEKVLESLASFDPAWRDKVEAYFRLSLANAKVSDRTEAQKRFARSVGCGGSGTPTGKG